MEQDPAHILYRFHGADDSLLYVGITADPPTRFRSHRKSKQWWSEVTSVRLEHHASRDALRCAERDAIRAERPRYNIVHNVSWNDELEAAITESIIGTDASAVPMWVDIATAPWFGCCGLCNKELDRETVAKLFTGSESPYGAPGPWHCVTCASRAMREAVKTWGAHSLNRYAVSAR